MVAQQQSRPNSRDVFVGRIEEVKGGTFRAQDLKGREIIGTMNTRALPLTRGMKIIISIVIGRLSESVASQNKKEKNGASQEIEISLGEPYCVSMSIKNNEVMYTLTFGDSQATDGTISSQEPLYRVEPLTPKGVVVKITPVTKDSRT